MFTILYYTPRSRRRRRHNIVLTCTAVPQAWRENCVKNAQRLAGFVTKAASG